MIQKTLIPILFITLHSTSFSQNLDELYQTGKAAFENYDMETVKSSCEEYIKLDSTNADVYYLLGMSKSDTYLFGGFEEFNKAVELDPNHAYALMARGNYYSYTDKEALALADYIKAHELVPNDEGILENLAGAKKSNSDLNGAIEDYTTIIELNSYNRMHGLAERGQIYLELKKYDLAIKDLETAIAEGAFFCSVSEALGDCYKAIGDEEKACYFWNEVLSNDEFEMGACQSVKEKLISCN